MLVSREVSSDFESLNPVLEGISDDTVLAIKAEDSLNGVTPRLRNVHKEESVSERQHLVVLNHRSSAVCLRLPPLAMILSANTFCDALSLTRSDPACLPASPMSMPSSMTTFRLCLTTTALPSSGVSTLVSDRAPKSHNIGAWGRGSAPLCVSHGSRSVRVGAARSMPCDRPRQTRGPLARIFHEAVAGAVLGRFGWLKGEYGVGVDGLGWRWVTLRPVYASVADFGRAPCSADTVWPP